MGEKEAKRLPDGSALVHEVNRFPTYAVDARVNILEHVVKQLPFRTRGLM